MSEQLACWDTTKVCCGVLASKIPLHCVCGRHYHFEYHCCSACCHETHFVLFLCWSPVLHAIGMSDMPEFAERKPIEQMESRKWSSATLLEGVAGVLLDADIDLPDDLEQLQD